MYSKLRGRRMVLIRNAPLHSIPLATPDQRSASVLRWTELIRAGGRKSVDDSLTALNYLPLDAARRALGNNCACDSPGKSGAPTMNTAEKFVRHILRLFTLRSELLQQRQHQASCFSNLLLLRATGSLMIYSPFNGCYRNYANPFSTLPTDWESEREPASKTSLFVVAFFKRAPQLEEKCRM